jgi:hypothetical protein
MSANEIELTFIRCPSCKSLMPSTAVKCGMCGFDLGAGDDDRPISEPVKKSRLRQKTFTGNLEDLERSEESFEAREGRNPEESVDVSEEDDARESGSVESRRRTPTKSNILFETRDSDSDTGKSRDFEDTVSRESKSESRGLRFSEDLREKRFTSTDEVSDQNESSEDNNKNKEGEGTGHSAVSGQEDEPVKKKRKRRRKKKRPVDGDSGQEEDKSATVRRVTPVNRIPANEKSEPIHPPSGNPLPVEAVRKEEFLEKSNLYQEEKQDHSMHAEPIRQKVKPSVGESLMSGKMEDATLVGWFVNYSTNAKGLSFEIRVGRQFVGRQSLRGDDLIIQDSAVSTPHCLLQVDDSTHVMLQDLMSEQGTYVKKNGSSEYERIDSSIQLEHGDRVKLGSYELVICLVP